MSSFSKTPNKTHLKHTFQQLLSSIVLHSKQRTLDILVRDVRHAEVFRALFPAFLFELHWISFLRIRFPFLDGIPFLGKS